MKTQCMRASQKKRDGKREFYEGPILQTALLKWVMRHEFMTTSVPGYTSFQEMEEDFSVARGLAYTDAEKKFLTDKKVQVALGSVCRQCRECQPTCPAGVVVPELMRALCVRRVPVARRVDELRAMLG
jgi:predicted aldo/keto reductase-like oxidoreductase